jgi:cell division protein FtsZ
MASPLLEAGAIDGAKGILINISGSSNLKLSEVNEASTLIQNAAHEEANIIFGAVLDESMGDEVKITVIATGFRKDHPKGERSAQDSRALKPEAPAFLNLDTRPAAPRFASEVGAETARASMLLPDPPAPGYASGFGSQSLATFEPAPRSVETPVAKIAPSTHPIPEDAAIGGFLDTLTAEENRAKEQRRAEDAELEALDVPAFMRQGGR